MEEQYWSKDREAIDASLIMGLSLIIALVIVWLVVQSEKESIQRQKDVLKLSETKYYTIPTDPPPQVPH